MNESDDNKAKTLAGIFCVFYDTFETSLFKVSNTDKQLVFNTKVVNISQSKFRPLFQFVQGKFVS